MLTVAIVALSLLTGQSQPVAGRYEAGERLKRVDRDWMHTADRNRRSVAVPKISKGMASLAAGQYGDACRAFDDAAAGLEGRELRAEDAISLRFDPPFAEPNSSARLRITWAYLGKGGGPVRITVGKQSVVAAPGRSLTLTLGRELLNPDAVLTPEVGYVVPIQVGGSQRGVYLSVVKGFRQRLAALLTSTDQEVLTLARAVQRQISSPQTVDTDLPLIQHLFTAELLNEGRLKLDSADELPLVEYQGTAFRVAFPTQIQGARGHAQPVTAVIALPDALGNESSYFESYGTGAASLAAVERGWVFASARPGDNSIANVLAWLQTRRGLKIGRLFVIGHGEGAATLLASLSSMNPAPSGIALLASTGKGPTQAPSMPTYVGVGKQDSPSILAASKALIDEFGSRKDCRYEEFSPAEHQTVVSDAIPSVYQFFDGLSK